MKVLILNAGSSSQKSCLYEIPDDALLTEAPQPLWEGKVNWTQDRSVAEIEVKTAGGETLHESIYGDSRQAHVTYMLYTLSRGTTKVIGQLSEIDVVGHRVVHGGQNYRNSVIITEEVKQAIAKLSNLAPAHNPAALEGIEAIEKSLGDVPQVAVFDTGFHATLPDAAAIYPGPFEWVEQGIRRYGFHGISHQYCSARAAQILGRDLASLRIITCHLGNGCSLAAIKNGRSIDTTMGFTPLDGLMMGSRSGSIDPGIIVHLMRQSDYSAERLDYVLNKASGLRGISGVSSDLPQVIEAITQGNYRAQLAWDMYVHRLRSGIGSMLASLGGLDVLVFTAGVGEKSPGIRQAACEAFGFLGLKLDPEKNQNNPVDIDIATADSTVRVLVIHTQEDWAIAQQCWHLLNR
ncbi:acetate kinase [Trichormus variabilis ATCC 29413]|uniref:Acetate kinase n=2 Tax=Anabaena variabilis TaxID=264691 RepID=ACKA_TRIV2|nr:MULTISPECIES: acetate kinase [Nostocaceae]Q3MFX2.1 RecName: Full=Acetate kinase; AltName: Full=Acetokinase [Trichormus variabilis ATCC 29413]ABA20114.1 acetate kinase [Trichormus variabilis ATCC 29413]MBC1215157.1 acetate kinase [Trichormus variabilis ARAD]MBC1257522.1 acetate kinase [Trichormus variabilis V5]MBC1267303.1 acetate kinase [Trichormus variabilis FSR]MBC1304085.1 acetate kinase [Trichormus variabilis N2B]